MSLLVASQAEVIPGYRLIERLGQGGFGEVWKAEAPGGLLKAVKIIHGSLSQSGLDATQLNQELKALHRVKTVRHPYILSLDRFDIVDGRLIIVTELADCTLFDRFQQCRTEGLPGIPREELLRYLEEAAEALDLMNVQFNLQHLDIKPQNLFLLYNHVKVADFGLVKDLEGMFAKITSGVTAAYAAPETFEGVVSRYCDQYNLAIAFQELLTGQLPYNGTSARQLMLQHLSGAPNLGPLRTADRPAVARALSRKPEDRYPSCRDFVRALRQAESSAPQDGASGSPPLPVPLVSTKETRSIALATPVDALRRPTPIPSAVGRLTGEHSLAVPAAPPERPETTGPGVLMPAVVVGLGGLGREVLVHFRKSLRKRSSTETWPHLRVLNVDTDPAANERAMREPDSVLSARDFLLTPLQRPSHYVKLPQVRKQLERWFPLNLLNSVPRGQTSAGRWRPLGRLAFVSCAAAVTARLRQELQACCDEKTMQDVARRTGLGLRTTRPRAYVVASLTGGTGSGMFLDVACALRRELEHLGHPRAEVVGVFLVPAMEPGASRRGVANTFAALTELRHFAGAATAGGAPDQSIDGRGHLLPFDRCVLLPLPAKADGPAAIDELTALAGDFLCRELTSPLGRTADEARAALGPRSIPGMICQTFGAFWFSVPRRPLLQRVAQQICDRLVRRWMVNDPKALEDSIKRWVADQLSAAKLSAESLAAALEESCAAGLGQKPGVLFDALAARWGKGGAVDLGRNPESVQKALDEAAQVVGPPGRDVFLDPSLPIGAALENAWRVVAKQAEDRLAELTASALAEPHFRFACKEEAAQAQIGIVLDEAAHLHQRVSKERHRDALDLLRQILPLQEQIRARGMSRAAANTESAASIAQILAQYLAARWDSMVASALSRIFEDLQINLYKCRRTVGCCHRRIGQFLDTFASSPANEPHADLGLGRYLLPFGCRTMDEAVARILDRLPPKEEEALHRDVSTVMRTMFRDKVHVCTAPDSLVRGLREWIDREVEKVAAESLGRAHAAEAYLEQHGERSDADDDLAGAYDEAQPQLAGSQSLVRQGFCILAVPPGPEGERFRALVRHALPDTPMHAAASTDDIVFYREVPHLSLTALPQTGPAARELYQQVLTSEQYGPHSRNDIVAW